MSTAARFSPHTDIPTARHATTFGAKAHPRRAEALAAAGGAVTMFAVGASLVTNADSGTSDGATAGLYLGVWLLLAVAGLLTALVGAAGVRSFRGIGFQIAAAALVLIGGVTYLLIDPAKALTGAGVGLLFGLAWVATLVALQLVAMLSRKPRAGRNNG
jgi:hypothetical protein